MAFEFFFGLCGLLSSDSKSRHKSRLDSDWRLFTPLGAGLLRDSQKTSLSGAHSPSFKSSNDLQRPIFSTSGTLAAANGNSVSDGIFSSTSSSSVFSVTSSGSNSSAGSTATLIKPTDPSLAKKYEFLGSSGLTDGGKAHNKVHDESVAAAAAAAAISGSDGIAGGGDDSDSTQVASSRITRLRAIYCGVVCLGLWLHVLRLLVGLLVEKSLLTLDFYYLGAYRIHFLIPALCLAIQVAAVSLMFIRNNDETNWLVPFYSSKDYLIRSRSNFKPKIEDYTKRVNISVGLALVLALISSLSLSAYLIHCVMQSEAMQDTYPHNSAGAVSTANRPDQAQEGARQVERTVLTILLVTDILWAVYSTHICFLVSFYFNLICSIMKARFHGISKIIEDLAECNTTKTTNQARKITTLYLEHNEACELLDESNDFWQYLIFFTYFTYIPAYCYCLYNLFFVDFEAWPSFITWVIHTHTGFIILLISFSAAGVSTETAAACASYFLIVADFSRSSVFTLAQMNGTAAVGGGAAATGASSSAIASGQSAANVGSPAVGCSSSPQLKSHQGNQKQQQQQQRNQSQQQPQRSQSEPRYQHQQQQQPQLNLDLQPKLEPHSKPAAQNLKHLQRTEPSDHSRHQLQPRQEPKLEHQREFDIKLDRNNVIFYHRYSMNRFYLKINRRSKRPLISTRDLTSLVGNDASRINFLSMIITVERVNPSATASPRGNITTPNPDSDTTRAIISNEQNATAPVPKMVNSKSTNAANSAAIGPRQRRGVRAKMAEYTEVRLRGNLTELYICFDKFGNLGARVDGNSSSCLFREITLEHMYLKYQSKTNSSWYIGFDSKGNPISGQEVIKRDGSHDSVLRERFYQFRKLDVLKTSTKYFPTANKLIDSPDAPSESIIKSDENPEEEEGPFLPGIQRPPATSLESHVEHTFYQRQLLNMTRYRNILRYQLGRAAGQPLLSETDLQSPSLSSRVKSRVKKKKKKIRKKPERDVV